MRLDVAAGARGEAAEHQLKLQSIHGGSIDNEASDRDAIVAIKQFKRLDDMEDAHVRDYVRCSQVEALF